MPAKRLKISKKTISLDKPKRLMVSKYSLVELKKIKKQKLIRFSKMTKWSPIEKYQFYKGLKAFGLDFDMVNKVLLPHRSIKDIFTYLKREDKRNSLKIDYSLEWFRKNSLYKKDSIDVEAYSKNDFSLTDNYELCNNCNIFSSKLNLDLSDIPSLESILEETKLLQM